VTGRAMAVIWPLGQAGPLRIPSAFSHVPPGQTPPPVGIIKTVPSQTR
jgi:hypothetical protein